MSQDELTMLDLLLQEMAKQNWTQFVKLIGEDNITTAKACLLRGNGSSYGSIAIRLNLNKRQAQWRCAKCDTQQEDINNVTQ